MRILKMYPSSINDQYIDMLADELRNGAVVVVPTDTRYALACDSLNNKAIERICNIKGIDPAKHYLSIVCGSLSQASEYAIIDNRAFPYLKSTLPGPFTYILPSSPRLPKIFKKRRQVGIRVPDEKIVRRLAEELGNPLMTTTARWAGADEEDTFNPDAIALALSRDVDFVIDAGELSAPPSRIVDLTDSSDPQILRR